MKVPLILSLLFLFFAGAKGQEKVLIYFDYDRSDLTPSSRQTLDSFILQKKILFDISLTGHCDARGSNEYNDRLSLERLQTVKQFLISHGLADTLIKTSQAFGERQPLNANSNEQEMAVNRRVEIVFNKSVAEIKKEIPVVKTLSEKIKDTSTKVGGRLVLKNLNFEGGRHVLLPYSVPILEELLQTLRNNPSLEIAIEGHVCCAQGTIDGLDIDTKTYNLSVNRAKVVYDYLVKNGIDSSRLAWDGYGNQYPLIYPEITEDDRTTNRRVEIKIVKK